MSAKHNNGYKFTQPASIKRLEKVRELLAKPHTANQLGEAAFISKNGALRYIIKLQEDGVHVRICDWITNYPGSPTPVYVIGEGRNKRKPRRKTAAERKEKYRSKEGVREREATRKALRRIKPHRDPAVAALFGVAP